MRARKSKLKVNRERAIQLTMATNGVSHDIAGKYTDSELKEVLRLLKLKADF